LQCNVSLSNAVLTVPGRLAQTFQTALLDVINCIVAVSNDKEVQSIMDRDVVALVLPLCHADAVRVRLQALWIVDDCGLFWK
jgi:hypothetical protein